MNNEVRKMVADWQNKYGSSLTWFAEKIGITRISMSKWKNNNLELSEERLKQLIKVMND